MKKDEKKELLTSELYLQISNDKIEEISSLKSKRLNIINKLKQLKMALNEAREQKREINSRIRNLNYEIINASEKKFTLSRELKKQKKLSNKLDIEITKEDSYINVNKFYPENAEAKKR